MAVDDMDIRFMPLAFQVNVKFRKMTLCSAQLGSMSADMLVCFCYKCYKMTTKLQNDQTNFLRMCTRQITVNIHQSPFVSCWEKEHILQSSNFELFFDLIKNGPKCDILNLTKISSKYIIDVTFAGDITRYDHAISCHIRI